ncbi:MAG: hypothetical protein BWX45_00682 [Deltaproteobacteria bacterium ADurb.Bin002]|nr:MAG: hypothetical protein BWX45_00682 [Deltaproteobacteria bacterium ADurb.Bin002]
MSPSVPSTVLPGLTASSSFLLPRDLPTYSATVSPIMPITSTSRTQKTPLSKSRSKTKCEVKSGIYRRPNSAFITEDRSREGPSACHRKTMNTISIAKVRTAAIHWVLPASTIQGIKTAMIMLSVFSARCPGPKTMPLYSQRPMTITRVMTAVRTTGDPMTMIRSSTAAKTRPVSQR